MASFYKDSSGNYSLASSVQPAGGSRTFTRPATQQEIQKATASGATSSSPQYEQVTPELLESPAQKQASDFLRQTLSSPVTQYTKQRVADLPYEQEIRQSLESYAGREQNPLLGQSQQVLSDTLTGQYDPNTSQYYQGLRQAQELNLNDALNKYSQRQFLGGNLRATPTDTGQARLIAENTASLNQQLGQLSLQERQNQLNAVNQAQSLAQQQDQFGLNTLNAYTSVSPLLQQQAQAQADADYQEFLRQQQQPIDLATLLYQTGSTYQMPQYRQADTLGNVINRQV